MKVANYIGFLQEEVHKYDYSLEVLDDEYLLEKIFYWAQTINREAIKANEGVETLYSHIQITDVDNDHIYKNENRIVFKTPTLLQGVYNRETKGLVAVHQGKEYIIGRGTIGTLFSNKYSRYSSNEIEYALAGNDRLVLINTPGSTPLQGISWMEIGNTFIVGGSPTGNTVKLYLNAILADQRQLLNEGDDVYQMELKVASAGKLQMLARQEIFSSLGIKEDGNKDSNQRTS